MDENTASKPTSSAAKFERAKPANRRRDAKAQIYIAEKASVITASPENQGLKSTPNLLALSSAHINARVPVITQRHLAILLGDDELVELAEKELERKEKQTLLNYL
uniref:CSON014640 protein n=1 Tax=Culicoides sonorensis TaxID=179676 RepID=A0A336MB87_CULSO